MRHKLLRRNMVCTIAYQCRNIGYGIEEGTLTCYWTGEIDMWGKHTLQPVNGGEPIYLFADEIREVIS